MAGREKSLAMRTVMYGSDADVESVKCGPVIKCESAKMNCVNCESGIMRKCVYNAKDKNAKVTLKGNDAILLSPMLIYNPSLLLVY